MTAGATHPTIEGAIARLQAYRATMGCLPSEFSEDLAVLLIGSARLGHWSHVAKALYDQGAAIALYVSLFPADRWMLGHRLYGPTRSVFDFAVYPPYVGGEETSGDPPEPLCAAEHDVCGIAIVIAALRRRVREPLTRAASRVVAEVKK